MDDAHALAARDARAHVASDPGWLRRGVLRLLNDPRDLPFVVLMAQCTLIVLPLGIALFLPGVFRWELGVAYLAVLFFGFVDRFILMLHNTSHRRLFRREFEVLNHYIPWVLGPFFGETPETYHAHHIGMHHVEANGPTDLSSTMRYQRDNLLHFLHYVGSFLAFALWDLSRYFAVRGRWRKVWPLLAGEFGFYALVIGLWMVNWQATLVVFVLPFFMVRFLMMAGNWGQHAFIDPSRPDSAWLNSITCVDSRYNRRCFNDGYHIGHHLKPGMHWSEMPEAFAVASRRYADEGAFVFRGIDFFIVWVLLMTRQHRALASRLLHLGDGEPAPIEARVALLRSRLQPIR